MLKISNLKLIWSFFVPVGVSVFQKGPKSNPVSWSSPRYYTTRYHKLLNYFNRDCTLGYFYHLGCSSATNSYFEFKQQTNPICMLFLIGQHGHDMLENIWSEGNRLEDRNLEQQSSILNISGLPRLTVVINSVWSGSRSSRTVSKSGSAFLATIRRFYFLRFLIGNSRVILKRGKSTKTV